MSWMATTYADDNPIEGSPDGRTVAAPCCGRDTAADMLVKTSGIPAPLRPRGASYICDGGRERLVMTKKMTRVAMLEALGAPRAIVAQIRRKKEDL